MVNLMRFLIVMASVISLFVLNPLKAQRMSRHELKGEVKNMRKAENMQQRENL